MWQSVWLVSLLLLVGCGPSRFQLEHQQREQEYQRKMVIAKADDDKNRAEYIEKAKRLDIAADATKVPDNTLTTREALFDYSEKLDVLFNLISGTQNDPNLQSPKAWRWPYIEPSLKRAREAAAAGLITKGKAQLQMKDFDGARNTLRQVVVVFNPSAYGSYTRQAEFLLQDVEKAEAASRKYSLGV